VHYQEEYRQLQQELWSFKTKDFEVVCEAYEPGFIDPLAHEQETIDEIDRGDAILMHLTARVCWRGSEVGEARLPDCIYWSEALPEDSEWGYAFDKAIVIDPNYRRRVARWAISHARKTLGELELPGLYLRKTE
jgi:hypothetical protein